LVRARAEPEGCEYQEGDDVGDERAAEAQKTRNQLRGSFGMEVFRQLEFDHEERHREGEDAVGQGIEPALRNKLLGLSLDPPRLSCLEQYLRGSLSIPTCLSWTADA
jgi:hypothetical protein